MVGGWWVRSGCGRVLGGGSDIARDCAYLVERDVVGIRLRCAPFIHLPRLVPAAIGRRLGLGLPLRLALFRLRSVGM